MRGVSVPIDTRFCGVMTLTPLLVVVEVGVVEVEEPKEDVEEDSVDAPDVVVPEVLPNPPPSSELSESELLELRLEVMKTWMSLMMMVAIPGPWMTMS